MDVMRKRRERCDRKVSVRASLAPVGLRLASDLGDSTTGRARRTDSEAPNGPPPGHERRRLEKLTCQEQRQELFLANIAHCLPSIRRRSRTHIKPNLIQINVASHPLSGLGLLTVNLTI
jgi:hypothetical protein